MLKINSINQYQYNKYKNMFLKRKRKNKLILKLKKMKKLI